jgi:hypothetical protein
MQVTTPNEITAEIIVFCREIDPIYKPFFVPVKASEVVRHNFCMTDVPRYAKNYGGKVQLGWIIWEAPSLFLEAEFHATWVSPAGVLIDVTPKPDGERQILYLKDSVRVYENVLVDNIRKPLIDNWVMKLWLIHSKIMFLVRKNILKTISWFSKINLILSCC